MALDLKHVTETGLITVRFCSKNRFFYFNSYLKQLYISHKIEQFSNRSGYSIKHIEAFKRIAGLVYRQRASGYQ